MKSRHKKLAHGTLRSLASMINNCLKQACYDRAISFNPVKDLMSEIVAKPKTKRFALTKEQVKVMIDFLKIEGTWQNVYLPLVGIGLSTGCRFGELVGLTWNDVDFERKVISINHSINYAIRTLQRKSIL